ncbi:hypothetical protein Cni_G23934 [Canna indica]|uniref:Uncharacterized protein n=1 Tax=Canna indica TaxID=4628 RepID=A0AAQ3KUD3_9LILI|nr:hypothetical protein Cni_G23934 [Canna indica]
MLGVESRLRRQRRDDNRVLLLGHGIGIRRRSWSGEFTPCSNQTHPGVLIPPTTSTLSFRSASFCSDRGIAVGNEYDGGMAGEERRHDLRRALHGEEQNLRQGSPASCWIGLSVLFCPADCLSQCDLKNSIFKFD